MESKARVREQVEDPQRLIRVHEAATDPHPVYTTDAEATAIATTVSAASVATHEAAADPHTGYQKESEKNAANGYCGLDAGVLVPVARLPVATTTTAGATTLGTSADGVSGKVVQTDDARLTDARTPTAHATSHKHSGSDEVATATAGANLIPKAGAGGTLAIGWIPTGTSSTTVCIGNDARLSDARTPTAHASSHRGGGGSDPLQAAGVSLLGNPTVADPADVIDVAIDTTLEFTGGTTLQRAALTGDVTASAGSNTTTIANDAVTFAKMQNSAAAGCSVIGRSTNSAGDFAEVAAGSDELPLRRKSNVLGFGAIGATTALTLSTTDRLVGRDTAAAGAAEELTVGGGVEFTGSGGIQRSALTGDVTATAGSNSTTIANDAVTNAKMANVATQTFKGRTTAGTGDPEDLTLAQARTLLACPYVLTSEAGNPVRTIGASSTAEATLTSLSLTANSIGTTGYAVLEFWGDMLQNSGAANSSIVRVKIGATTVFQINTAWNANATKRPIRGRIVFAARGATNLQRITGEYLVSWANAPAAGYGSWYEGSTPFYGGLFLGDAAEDSTTNLTLAVTHQWSVSHASSYWQLYGAKLIVYP